MFPLLLFLIIVIPVEPVHQLAESTSHLSAV